MSVAQSLRRVVAGVASIALVLTSQSVFATQARADTSPPAGEPETLTATPLPTWQTNGTVWSIAIVNGVTYVGGNFTAVRPPGAAPGTQEVERRHLAAFNSTTGDLLPWAPKATSAPVTMTTPDKDCTSLGNSQYECASVRAIRVSPDATTLYVGGDFGFIDGKSRAKVAAFNLPTGTLNATFKPSTGGGRVYSIAPTNTEVYIGGSFTQVLGQTRTRLAAVSKANALLPWAPSADKAVLAMVVTPDNSRVVVGGKFDLLNGTARHGIGALLTADGSRAPWVGNQIDNPTFVTSLTADGDLVYTTGDAQGSTSEGVIAIDPYTGTTAWNDQCRGASHSMAIVRGVVYAGSHAHDCNGMVDGFGEQYSGYPTEDRNRYKLRAQIPTGDGRARLLHWFPETNDGNGPRAMATDGNQLWLGGEFTLLNDTLQQQGLTRYAFRDSGGVNFTPKKPQIVHATATSPEKVTINWQTSDDKDNRRLEYWVIKDHNVNNPIAKVTADSKLWAQPWLSVVDNNVTPGSTHSYDVRAVDPLGKQSPRSTTQTVTLPTSDVAPQSLAANDKASWNYRFEDNLNSTVNGRTATKGTFAAYTSGFLGNGLDFTGRASSSAVQAGAAYAKRYGTFEAMFRTNGSLGGVLMSLGNSNSVSGTSSTQRNMLYMSNNGRLNWGFRPDGWNATGNGSPYGTQQAVATAGSYNDNAWHHVVATFEPGTGARIWVDGNLVAENPGLNWSRTLNGYFRMGGDRVASWPNQPSSDWWTGRLDEVAAYDYPLSPAQIKMHADAFLSRPGAPTGLKGTATGESSVRLTWNASPNATEYRVIRDGNPVATVTDTSYDDTGLNAKTAYAYSVVALNASGAGGETGAVTVTTDKKADVVVLAKGAVWKYSTSGVETQGWKSVAFDDSEWASGPAELGHGEGDEATAITPFMPNGTTRRITTYFRSTFDVASHADVTSLAMQLKRDDGVIIYLNGQEVFRDLMPGGDVTAETLATTWAGDDGQTFLTRTLPTAALTQGTNVIAVEIHQNARSSLDLSFDMELTTKF